MRRGAIPFVVSAAEADDGGIHIAEEELAMVEAYVLIQAQVGAATDVCLALSAIDGVRGADVVTGPYDVIARAEAADVDELGRLVVSKIQGIAGVARTLTCPVVRL
jgi:DNA-binding Lrp family transcriptional regulator